MGHLPPVVRAVVRDGLTLAGCLLLLINGGLYAAAGLLGYGAGWKAWAMPVTGLVMILLAARMIQVRLAREGRIRKAGHTRRAWTRPNN
jgi:hypothetical protein